MINFPASSRTSIADRLKLKQADEKYIRHPQATPLPPAASDTLPVASAALSRIYFGGVNLNKAIEGSNEVAQSQALDSEMSLQEYVDNIATHPLLLRNSAQYAQDLINREGVNQIKKYGQPINEYRFFSTPNSTTSKGLKGNQGSINDIMLHIRAAARKQDLGKKPIVLMGGPGSGKSTIGDLLVEGYARYSKTDEGARYATKLINLPEDLRMGEEYVDETLADPLLFLPPAVRREVVESAQDKFLDLKNKHASSKIPIGYLCPNLYDYELGVEGSLTPKSEKIVTHLQDAYLKKLVEKQHLDKTEWKTPKGREKLAELKRAAYQQVLNNHVRAYRFEHDANKVPGGIGVFAATDSKTLNTAKINGQVNMVRLMDLPESDSRRYDYSDGAAFRGNRGLLRFKEMHKNPEAFYPLLLDLAQSQLIEIESGTASVNTLIIADSNFPELIEKKGKDVLNAAMKRLDHVYVTHPLEWSAEKQIQDGLFKDFENHPAPNGRLGHVAPHTKEVAALLAVMSRLILPDDKIAEGLPFLAKKAAAYDGKIVEGIEEKEVHEWYEKGQKTEEIEQKEGMDGLSVREMQTLTNMVTGNPNVLKFNAVDGFAYLRITRDVLEKNRMSLSPEMKQKALDLLKVSEHYLDDQVKGDVSEVLAGNPEYLNTLFTSYMDNVTADQLHQNVQDPLTGEMVPADTELMEDIEKRMGITSSVERKQFRAHLAAVSGSLKKAGRSYELETDPKLKKAILDRAYAKTVDKIDSKVLLTNHYSNESDADKMDTLVSRLKAKGYNDITARNAIARVRMLAKKDPKILNS